MIITLTTDFGTADAFTGAMKGVILSIAPRAQIVDISHDVPPQDVLAGALLLEEAYAFFPKGTIHVAVADPGVGSARAPIAVQTDRYAFVGPDNGIFTLALNKERGSTNQNPKSKIQNWQAVRLTNAKYHLPAVSATFHGRDIFAPVAAHLARGVPLKQFGPAQRKLVELSVPQPVVSAAMLGLRVLRSDRFGNLITNLWREEYVRWNPKARAVRLKINGKTIDGMRRTFSDVAKGKPVAYFGSGGRLEIAVNRGSAAEFFGARAGSQLMLKIS